MACDVADPVLHVRQAVNDLRTLGFFTVNCTVEGGHVIGAKKMLVRFPPSTISLFILVHAVFEGKGRVEGNLDFCRRFKEATLVNLLPFLPANAVEFVFDFLSQQELAPHERGDVYRAHANQVPDEVAQPFQKFVLAEVRPTHLPVQPEGQGFRRPAFHRYV